MSTITTEAVLDAMHRYIIYSFSTILIVGVIGNVFNIIVLTNVKKFRKYPASYYIIVESIAALGVLLFGALLRLLEEILSLPSNRIGFIWCKIRNPILQWFALMVLFVVNFQVIDQYFSTSLNPLIRQWSTVKLSKHLITIAATSLFLYNIPFINFFDMKFQFGCFITGASIRRYYLFFHLLILHGVLPMTVASIFSISAYRNVRRIRRQQISNKRRRIDEQLTAMILARVILFVLCLLPYIGQAFYTMYTQNHSTHPFRAAVELFITAINVSISYLNVSGTFYAFLIASARFRRQTKYVLFKKHCKFVC